MKRSFVLEETIQIGNCVDVDVVIKGTFEHVKATSLDPEDCDINISSVELEEGLSEDDLLDLAQQLYSAEAEQKAPWVSEDESDAVTAIIRETMVVTFQGSSDQADTVVQAFLEHTRDDDAICEMIMETWNSGDLFDDAE